MYAANTHAFQRAAHRLANVLRLPLMVDGKRGAPVLHFHDMPCTPLEPVSAELAQRAVLQTPNETWQTFIALDYEVKAGDTLVMLDTGKVYPVRYVEEHPWGPGQITRRLVVEELRR